MASRAVCRPSRRSESTRSAMARAGDGPRTGEAGWLDDPFEEFIALIIAARETASPMPGCMDLDQFASVQPH